MKHYIQTALKSHYHDLNTENIATPKASWAFSVYLVDSKVVVREAKENRYREGLEGEAALLSHLGPLLPVTVPQYQLVDSENGWGAYDLIPGCIFSEKIFNSLSTKQQKEGIAQVATIIRALQSVKTEELPQTMPPEPDAQEIRDVFYGMIQRIREGYATSEISNTDIDTLSQYVEGLINFKTKETVLCHSDLYSRNMIWSPEEKGISGLIDFSDASLGSRHKDFSSLDEFLLEPVLAHFPEYSSSPEFKQRVYFLRKRFSLFHLHGALTGAPTTRDEALAMFHKDFNEE